MQKITLLLVDDHSVIRSGLRALLSVEKDFEIVGEAASGRDALKLTEQLQPNVVVMDLSMPLLNGVEATRQISAACHSTQVVVLSAYQDSDHVERAVAAGAGGYVLKHSAAIDLINAIRDVAAGKAYFSPAVAKQLRDGRISFNKPPTPETPSLTMREAEVLQLITEGFMNKQIASELSISIKTVEKHRQAVMNKLNLHCIADLVRHAIAKGVVDAPMSFQQAV